MIYIKPSFYDDFKCIASECSDNCCIGWEIDVDENTLQKYNGLNTPLGDEIRSKITTSEDGSKCFALGENDRCPFLNKKNLCRIIIGCGEDALCEICKNHPRFYEWFPGVTECGLGLSCEAVCRILLSDESPFTLVESEDDEPIVIEGKDETIISDSHIFISALRERFFDILFSSDKTYYEKLEKLCVSAQNFCGEDLPLRNSKKIIEAYSKTEPIDDNWVAYITDLRDGFDEYYLKRKQFKEQYKHDKLYPKILAYILYRHLIKAAFDADVLSRVCFCLEAIRFIELCDMKTYCNKGSLTLEDRIQNLKNWSKQVEYSEENTELLTFGEM